MDLQEGGGGGAGAGAGGGSRERTVHTTNLEELEDALRCVFFFFRIVRTINLEGHFMYFLKRILCVVKKTNYISYQK